MTQTVPLLKNNRYTGSPPTHQLAGCFLNIKIRTMTEKEITICGKKLKIRYCAATETGYEQLSGRSVAVFFPTLGKNEKGEVIIKEPSKATTYDFLMLAISGIAAAYSRHDEEPPLSSEDILYDASSEDTALLLNTVVELRNAWHNVPKVVAEAEQAPAKDKEDEPKN